MSITSPEFEFDLTEAGESRHSRYDRENHAARLAGWKIKNDIRGEQRLQAWLNKKFCFWDGEGSSVPDGTPQPYILFGNSDGEKIIKPQVGTEECLALIADADPSKIHVSFAFSYDVNQILWELPSRKMYSLTHGRLTVWRQFRIEWVDQKWLAVRRNIKGAPRITIFDTFHFFNCSFAAALEKFGIGTPEERAFITAKKADRPQFDWVDIAEIQTYWEIEGQLGVKLMAYVRDLFGQAGIYVKSWHGPGAVAREMMRSHGVKNAQKDFRRSNLEVWIAARYGFSGGRFQQFLAGLYEGTIYNWDIHAAYPYGMQFLPNLNTGVFRRVPKVDRTRIRPDEFAIYHIKYDENSTGSHPDYKARNRPRPLFRRLKNDNILWPDKVEGWYWSPEAYLVANDPAARFVEGWIFEDDGERPLGWISEVYNTREYHKERGNAIEYPFKLGMNSCYGQFAQRAGWQRYDGPPPFHQLEWAGFVTSMCKAMVYRAAEWAYTNNGLITIDTDGIFSTVKVPEEVLLNGIGNGLGQWEENIYTGILIWQNGFYWLRDSEGEWKKCRSRGAPRGQVDISKAWEALPSLGSIHYDKKIFTGFRYALQTDYERWRSWQTIHTEVKFGGTGKSQHSGKDCRKCLAANPKFGDLSLVKGMDAYDVEMSHKQLHGLFQAPIAYAEYIGRYQDNWSYMHDLPWVKGKEDMAVEPEIDPELEFVFEDDAL